MEVQKRNETRALLTGTFDVANFGDQLLALVAKERLEASGVTVVPVSPTGAVAAFADALPCISTAEMLDKDTTADGIIVGGGHIIHVNDMALLDEYRTNGTVAAPGLWLGATLAAALRDIPVVWNAPGVPHPIVKSKRALVELALNAADYLSVRDRGSVELLNAVSAMQVVPDSAASVHRLWTRRALDGAFRNLLQRKGADSNMPYMALHVRNRALGPLGAAGVAKLTEDFCRAQGIRPILIAIGPSLGDDATARAVASELVTPHILLDDPLSLAEIAAALANSRCYVGASLHAYIVAQAFGVPGMMMARPSYRKFEGFLEQTGRRGDIAKDWPEVFASIAGKGAGFPDRVFAALDAHWARIVEGLSGPSRRRGQRQDFLRLWQQAPPFDFTATQRFDI